LIFVVQPFTEVLFPMKATNWEFAHRALIFGLIFNFAFCLYRFDHQISTLALVSWLGPRLHLNTDLAVRVLFALAALLMVISAFVRTWASSYLHATVVYATEIKTESLVADGPYRRVRNPLYFANVLMAIGIGALASRSGFFLALVAMIVFCYRLILREEAELQTSQGEQYKRYREQVPRLLPSPWPRVASAGHQANWSAGFKAESWYWMLAAAVTTYAVTLNFLLFLIILTAGVGLLWASSAILEKKTRTNAG
jgi:protein-S-isoprenylcysteine O-methyltransferase Ste14